MPWSEAFALVLWLYTAIYGILLCRWSGKRIKAIVFPLVLLLGAVFLAGSLTAYFFVALLVLSWIRSGICFERSLKGLGAELVTSRGGGAVVSCFVPGSGVTWALGIWMFFLVQALYFVFFETSISTAMEDPVIDPFEKSRRLAEEILS